MKNFKPLPQDIRSDIARGILTCADLQVYCWLLLNCDWRDYSIRTSAPHIASALGLKVRTAERRLEKLRHSRWIACQRKEGTRGPYPITVHSERPPSTSPPVPHALDDKTQDTVPRGEGHGTRPVPRAVRGGDPYPVRHSHDEKKGDSVPHAVPRGVPGVVRGAVPPSPLDNRHIDNRGGDPAPSASEIGNPKSNHSSCPGEPAPRLVSVREHWRKVYPSATNISDAKADELFAEAQSAGIAPERMHELIDDYRRLRGDRGAAPWRILGEELKKARSGGGKTQECPMCQEGAIEYTVRTGDHLDYRRLRCPCHTGEARATKGARPLAGLPLLEEVFPAAVRKKWRIVASCGNLYAPRRVEGKTEDVSKPLLWHEDSARPATTTEARDVLSFWADFGFGNFDRITGYTTCFRRDSPNPVHPVILSKVPFLHSAICNLQSVAVFNPSTRRRNLVYSLHLRLDEMLCASALKKIRVQKAETQRRGGRF